MLGCSTLSFAGTGPDFIFLTLCIPAACTPPLSAPARGGRYAEPTVDVSGVAGTADLPAVIAAHDRDHDPPVVFDGTAPLPGLDWKKRASSNTDGVWTAVVPTAAAPDGVVQLFDADWNMWTPARWPNALFSDSSVFNISLWGAFDPTKPWNPGLVPKHPPVNSRPITFWDACSRSAGLAASGLNATGAVMIGNIAHDDTFVGIVTAHVPGQCQFDALFNVSEMGNTKLANSRYFFEGLPAFVDQPTEWAFDRHTRQLTVMMPAGRSPLTTTFRHKVRTFALNITKSAHLRVANMTLFGTTFHAADEIPHLRLESLQLLYPSFSRRMMGETAPATPTVLVSDSGSAASWGGNGARRSHAAGRPAPLRQDSSFTVFNCTWFGADGPMLRYFGTASTFENNLFDSNDWSAADDLGHQGMGSALIMAQCGADDVFIRNTLRNNGPSVGYATGVRATATLNYCTAQADVDNDGACIQIRSSSANNTTLEKNWAWKSVKGFRLDSGSNSAFVPAEVNNSIIRNVAVFTQGMELKNDFNRYLNNLVMWSPLNGTVRSGASSASAVFRVDSDRFATENSHSVVGGNVATSWTAPLRGIVPPTAPNMLGADVWRQIRDPNNLDFRPIAGTKLAQSGAGPYSFAETQPDRGTMWIPGRQEWRASMPIPPHGTTTAAPGLDLMFLPAFGRQTHTVWFGTSPGALRLIGTLSNGANIKSVTDTFTAAKANAGLAPGSAWWWRVDAIDATGNIIGPLWNFTVRVV